MEAPEGRKPLEVRQAGIGHLGACQMQGYHVFQASEVDEAGIGQVIAPEMKIDFQRIGVLSDTAHGATQFLNRGQRVLVIG